MNLCFHPWKVIVPLLKVVSFLCFHMSQAPSMKVEKPSGQFLGLIVMSH
jgi:hypothetical protein